MQGRIPEHGRQLQGLLAGRHGALKVPDDHAHRHHPGQHPSQPGSIVELSGPRLGLAQQGETPRMLSHHAQHAS